MFISCDFVPKDTRISNRVFFFFEIKILMYVAQNGVTYAPQAYVNIFFLLGIYRLFSRDVLCC